MPKLTITAAATLLLAAGAAQAASYNTVETNGLGSNALYPNALSPNALYPNGLAGNGLAGSAPTIEGVSLGELSGVQVEAVILPDPRR
jgi:hypothetical protein